MGVVNRFMNFLGLQEEEVREVMDHDDDGVEHHGYNQRKGKNNVVSLRAQTRSAQVVLMEPRSYDEAQDMGDHLKNRKAIVVNLQRVRHTQAIRIVDFLSGTVYALGGSIQKLGSNIFLCTPDSVEITGSITEMLKNENDDIN
ncbi:MAG: cell division protein SepF [Bacilli bacterium]